ncbi:protein kinase domain-containing protein [Ornithinimicrobium sufpigmenti]|uniref:protein kinase domain-containing protein n=1 Tax=Ornithinimicrobium sufpigmenti TaxID=2508882 RepID=UPI001035BD0B|nr:MULTISPECIES: protein kinase [unclassified Ornithinimicrobium]
MPKVTEPTLTLRLGEAFGEGRLHVICSAERKKTPRTKRAQALGKGGAGSVYPCLYGTHEQPRAVKFLTLNKLDEGRTGRRKEDFEQTFAAERAILSQLSHSHISIFHEDGIHTDDAGREWHYLITDHVAGPMLEDALKQTTITGDDVYKIVSDLLDAVSYLHHHGIYHCDIKLDNIRMRAARPKQYDVVLLDWGAAQVLHTEANETPSATTLELDIDPRSRRRFISTSDITHARHLPYLNGGTYSPQELRDVVPQHELHTLGVLLEKIISPAEPWSQEVRTKLGRTLGEQGVQVLDEMILDLRSSPTGDGYSTVDEVYADFKKLHRNYLSPAGVPELSLAAEFQYSVPTATGRAVMTRRISELTDHRLLNRLHQVHQLEATYLTFPGATHTRFSHSVAVLRNTRYYVSHLLNDSRFRRQAEREDLEATLLLALLHDVGHFQLSHMFEDLATDQAADRTAASWRELEADIPTDDTLFADVLGSPNSRLRGNFGEAIQARAASFTEESEGPYATLWEILIEGFGESTAHSLIRLHDVIYAQKKPEDATPAQRVLAAVLSSDIDADKTAYLVEDAQRTGVPYGMGVDLDGILGNVCMPTPDDFSRVAPNPVIGIRRAGVQAAQSVAVNRNQMLSQVYWHYNNRAITAMVKYPIMRLLAEGSFNLPDYVTRALFSSRDECLNSISELFSTVQGDKELNPIRGLLGGGRSLYKRVCEVHPSRVDEARELNNHLVKRSYDQTLAIQSNLAEELSAISQFRGIREGELLLDIPSKEREKPSGERGGKVFVYDRKQVAGQGNDLKTESPLYGGLKEQHEDVNKISRIFVSPRFSHLVADVEMRQQVAQLLVRSLKAEVGM